MRALLGVLLIALCAAAGSQLWAQRAPTPPVALTVKGGVERELRLSLDELKKLPRRTLDDVRVVRDPAAPVPAPAPAKEMVRHLVGCLVRDVLDRAGLVEVRRFDLRRSVVIASASDGYRALFSWAELYLSPIGEGAMIVYERDGAALPDSEGPLALVSLKDTRPGPRHVKWLRSLEVRVVAD